VFAWSFCARTSSRGASRSMKDMLRASLLALRKNPRGNHLRFSCVVTTKCFHIRAIRAIRGKIPFLSQVLSRPGIPRRAHFDTAPDCKTSGAGSRFARTASPSGSRQANRIASNRSYVAAPGDGCAPGQCPNAPSPVLSASQVLTAAADCYILFRMGSAQGWPVPGCLHGLRRFFDILI
jgi:hypothetical protein